MKSKVVLTICNGADAGRRLVLDDKSYCLVGRSRECGLQLSTPETSRRHCRLVIALPTIHLVDLHSHNGTFVNGQRVGPPDRHGSVGRAKEDDQGSEADLSPGDRIEIGGTLLEVAVSQEDSNHPTEPVAVEEIGRTE
jgi:pSer/pThr/pTyr-binding forkhead associated (FHA) protein